jgi:hypothetical protein
MTVYGPISPPPKNWVPKTICLQGECNDHSGRWVNLTVIRHRFVSSFTLSSGFEVILAKEGIFWRYDCYWYGSPYGWRNV